MTCREFADFLMDYTSGELSPAARAEFNRHLAECSDCVNYLENYRRTIALGRAAFAGDQDEVPEEVPQDLVRAVLAARAKTES